MDKLAVAREEALVACTPGAVQSASAALAHTFPLKFVHRVDDAVRMLASNRYCVLVGTLQFDDSRLFELLPAARSSCTPIIVAKLTFSHLPREVITHSFKAALLSGFDACIDLESLEQTLGHDKALIEVRDTVLRFARQD